MIQENKVITKYIADTEQEKRAIEDLIRSVDKLKAAESSAANSREQHFDQLVLDLTRANRGVETMNTNWGEAKTKGFSFGETMQGVAKTMAPWNQALELGGKAIRALDESMDAAAKKYPQYAGDIHAVQKEFAGLKEAVQAAAGVMVVELLKPIPSIETLKKRTEELQRQWMNFLTTGHSGADPLGGIGDAAKGVKQFFSADTWNANHAEDALDAIGKKMEEFKKRQAEAAKAAKDALRAKDFIGGVTYDYDNDPTKSKYGSSGILGGAAFQNYQGFAIDEQKLLQQVSQQHLADYDALQNAGQRYEDFNAQQSQSRLEQMFGPIDDVSAYQTAFTALSDAISGTYDAIVTGQEPASKALKRLLADGLLAIGKESSIKAIQELAYAAGSAAFGDFAGAGLHLKAAALHGAVAVGAGIAANSIGTSAQVSAADKAAADKAKEEERQKKESEKNGAKGGGAPGQDRVVVVYADPFADQSARERALTAEKVVKKALGGSGGVDN